MTSTGTEAGAQRRPHSAAARVGHRAVKAGEGGEEELRPGKGGRRRRRRRKHGHVGKGNLSIGVSLLKLQCKLLVTGL